VALTAFTEEGSRVPVLGRIGTTLAATLSNSDELSQSSTPSTPSSHRRPTLSTAPQTEIHCSMRHHAHASRSQGARSQSEESILRTSLPTPPSVARRVCVSELRVPAWGCWSPLPSCCDSPQSRGRYLPPPPCRAPKQRLSLLKQPLIRSRNAPGGV
jgi:hypothetical protein